MHGDVMWRSWQMGEAKRREKGFAPDEILGFGEGAREARGLVELGGQVVRLSLDYGGERSKVRGRVWLEEIVMWSEMR